MLEEREIVCVSERERVSVCSGLRSHRSLIRFSLHTNCEAKLICIKTKSNLMIKLIAILLDRNIFRIENATMHCQT